MSETDAIRVTTVVGIDPATAFEVFTHEVDAWWRRGNRYRFSTDRPGRMRFEPGVGGRLLEAYDDASGDAWEIGRIRVWEPAERLVFEWRGRSFEPGQQTEVEVRFEKEPAGTRVSIEHRGWDALPEDHPARHGARGDAFTSIVGLYWGTLLTDIRKHLTDTRS